jgi:HD-GYP domain-containing protein (c-di-GMP phosphodiesterase class II)
LNEAGMLGEISRALETRHKMRGHGERVSALAEAIALRLDWDAGRLETLRYAAPFHDVGKIAVPYEILEKRAPLTPDERIEIQRHPTAGASLVEQIRSARRALPYVLYHHERWDGGGYPHGIRGREIPEEARVLAVADAFDAMTSVRPYRRQFTIERALEEVRRCSGTQFDPTVAEAFLSVWDRGVLGDLPAAAAF